MVGYHRVPSSYAHRRMMCLEPLEVTGTSLTSSCIILCRSGTQGLYEGLLIKNRWRSTIAPWTTSTPPSSTCHLLKCVGLVHDPLKSENIRGKASSSLSPSLWFSFSSFFLSFLFLSYSLELIFSNRKNSSL